MRPAILCAAMAATAPACFADAGSSGGVPADERPAPVLEEDYAALRKLSPFVRALNLSDSLVITGFAEVEGRRVASVLNKETKETYVVSDRMNSQGWKMIDLKTDEDLEKVWAKVSIGGGEVVTIRYAEVALKPGEAKPAAGPSTEPPGGPTSIFSSRRRGFGGREGGSGRPSFGPSPEVREKMERLSEDQRRQLFDKMRELREGNPDMSWEERGRVFNEALERMTAQ